jgi:DNA-binding response OmpR family regulator
VAVAGRILIVEDDELLRSILKIVLTQEGFTVQVCANGQAAKDTLSADRDQGELPEMVILDLTMPVVDGWQVAAWMDADPVLKDVPVVVTSATEEHGLAASALHADAYLVKPYDTDEILGVVSLFATPKGYSAKSAAPTTPKAD